MKTRESALEFENLIFEGKNKNYGAFVLRKVYNKYVTISATGAIIIFALIVSYPLITGFIFPEEPQLEGLPPIIYAFENLPTQSIDKDKIDIPTKTQPKTSMVKYLAPVVTIDEQVVNDYFPTVEDFINKNPGTENLEGNPNGNDIIEVIIPDDIPVAEPETDKPYTWVEEMPNYKGGNSELIKYFGENLNYPEIAIRAGVEGKVILGFIVDRSGKIKDVKVLKGIGAGCDEEAIRVVSSMPDWNPGKQNGKPVNTLINIPVVFKLQ